MSDQAGPDTAPGLVSTRTMDVVVATGFALLGAVVMYESYELGAGWSPSGPESGYFPFYVGVLMLASGLITILVSIIGKSENGAFVARDQLWLVLQVLIPTVLFVALISLLGIYVSGALFIAFFMAWLGKYRWPRILPVAVLVPLALFLTFDLWFLIPLPKGPLEAWLGY
jgi:hypothetical protein